MKGRTLIRGGYILTLDKDVADVPYGDLLIENGKIKEIGRSIEAGDAEIIDAANRIVMPGFVDTHRHTWQTPIRGIVPSCTLDEYFASILGHIGTHYRAEDVYAANLVGALEAVNAGITTLLDWSHVNNTPEHSDEAIRALTESGVRAVYAHGVPVGHEWWALSPHNHPEDIRRLRTRYFSSEEQLLTLALAARAPGNTTSDVARHDWKLARDVGARISVHVGMRLSGVHVNHVMNLHELGLMGADTTYIHCTDSTDEELDLISRTGGSASLAPYVEMLMGHGVPPTGRLLSRGVRPSLSVDVVSSVPGDMFTQMRTALVQERILSFTHTPDIAFAPTLTDRDVLEFATIDGARACALDNKVGSLTPGKQADIILIRTDQINVVPLIDPVATVVICADTSNVDSVFVAGRPLKRNGQLVDVDMSRMMGLVERSRDYLLGKSGMLPEWLKH
jgi:5-methylthioadenosine/S-adenosylhomocysteine deaminase